MQVDDGCCKKSTQCKTTQVIKGKTPQVKTTFYAPVNCELLRFFVVEKKRPKYTFMCFLVHVFGNYAKVVFLIR